MSRALATALATIGCLIGAYLWAGSASADGPIGGLIESGLQTEPVDTHLICCAPIVSAGPEPVVEPLPITLVEDTLEPVLQSYPLDVVSETPIVEIPPDQPVIPTPPLTEQPEGMLPPMEAPVGGSPPTANQVAAPEPSAVKTRPDSPERSTLQMTKPTLETRASRPARPARAHDRPVRLNARLKQQANQSPSHPADIPTSRFSPATLLAPFDGAGLFKTTAGRDSTLAVIGAVLAVGVLWGWLRTQQRQRDRILLNLADSLHRAAGIFNHRLPSRAAGNKGIKDLL